MTRQGRSVRTVSSVLPNNDVPARRGGSDITTARARISRASSTIRRPAPPGANLLPVPGHSPAAADAGGVDQRGRARLLIGQRGVDRRVRRHRDRDQHVDAAPATGGEAHGGRDRLGREVAVLERHQHRLVLDLVLDRGLRHHDLHRLRQRQALAAAVDDVDDDPESEPEHAGDQHPQVEDGGHDQRQPGAGPAEDRQQRQLDAPRTVSTPGLRHGRSKSGWVMRSLISDRCAIVNESIAPKA